MLLIFSVMAVVLGALLYRLVRRSELSNTAGLGPEQLAGVTVALALLAAGGIGIVVSAMIRLLAR